MKKLLLSLSVIALLAACGKKKKLLRLPHLLLRPWPQPLLN